jgi:pimeloyl-ACP methyl ester carboxylesterase
LTPKKVVLVGHSFGSILSNAVLATNPGLVDGAILTGIGYDIPDTSVSFEAWQPRLASLQSPARWRQLDGGYITWVDIYANINTYVVNSFLESNMLS